MSKKETIVAFDLGTFCDFWLTKLALHKLKDKYDIVYVTPDINKVEKNYSKVIYYNQLDYIGKDPNMSLGDPSTSVLTQFVFKTIELAKTKTFFQDMSKRFLQIILDHKPSCVIAQYPALTILWQLPNNILTSIPFFVLYAAPAFPNEELPWIFDSVLTYPQFNIYSKELYAKNFNFESGLHILKRYSALYSLENMQYVDINSVFKKFNMFHHVCCYDSAITGSVIKLKIPDGHCHHIGSFKEPMEDSYIVLPDIAEFIESNKKIIFISLGTFTNNKILQKGVREILPYLENYCKKNDYRILFQSADINTKYIKSFSGFISYQYLVPRVKLVIFTGSVCLQTICFMHKKPMIFMPLLAEQYFWAKNFKHFTHLDFIDCRNKQFKFDIDKVFESNKLKLYLQYVSVSLLNSNASKDLKRLINETIKHHKSSLPKKMSFKKLFLQ